MSQSWEFYQQASGAFLGFFPVDYPLYWICGQGATLASDNPRAYEALSLRRRLIYAVPFDQVRPGPMMAVPAFSGVARQC